MDGTRVGWTEINGKLKRLQIGINFPAGGPTLEMMRRSRRARIFN